MRTGCCWVGTCPPIGCDRRCWREDSGGGGGAKKEEGGTKAEAGG